jgi:formylmethanofuran dehydrogenase subunit E
MDDDFKKAAEFHGHVCPGLAIGFRVARYVKDHYPRSEDEELVAVAENNSCSVDAVQALLGCTFGKGNLIFEDNGKQIFTFYSRDQGKALRIYFKDNISNRMNKLREKASRERITGDEQKEMQILREQIIQEILGAKEDEILSIKEVAISEPRMARIYPSLKCDECGENFMEIKGRTANGKIICKECFKKLVG